MNDTNGSSGVGGSFWSSLSTATATTTTSLYEDSLLDASDADASLLTKTVGADPATCCDEMECLSFLFLGCEPNMPYGPIDHTAQLVLDSLSQAVVVAAAEEKNDQGTAASSSSRRCWMLRMKLYNVQNEEYPTSQEEWDSYHGIILPGSYASAFNPTNESWIAKLYSVIQEQIVAHQRPTLGICFGHQVLAHSYGTAATSSGSSTTTTSDKNEIKRKGLATALKDGTRAGRYTMSTTPSGRTLLGGQDNIDLFYTHGDQVAQLPDTAVCLGGSTDGIVPILSAAYFATKEEAQQYPQNEQRIQNGGEDVEQEDKKEEDTANSKSSQPPRPFAITFQAHPEYTSSQDLGLFRTLEMILDFMVEKQHITKEHRVHAGKDAHATYSRVQRDGMQSLVCAGRSLGWWP